MRAILSLLLLACACPAAPQATFNKRFHFDHPAAHLAGVIATDSCYYASGMVIDTFGTFNQATFFAKFDLEGNPTLFKLLYSPTQWLYAYEPSFIGTDDGGFASLLMSVDSIRRFMLIKYDKEGDTVFTKQYEHPQHPDEDFLYPYSLAQTQEGGYLMVGNMEKAGGALNTETLTMKTDSLGNIIWKKFFGNNLADIGMKVIEDESGNGYLIGGARNDLPLSVEDYTFRSVISRIDTAGALLWQHLTPSQQLMGRVFDLVVLEDGSTVAASNAGTEIDHPSVNAVYFDKCVFKMSPDGEIIWQKVFVADYLSGSNYLTNIERASDGSGFVIAGTHHDPLWDQNDLIIWGWVSKVSNEGDSLWTRKYAFGEVGWRHNIFDMKVCPDGGYVICGDSESPFSMPMPQQAWLLNLDQHGCLIPGCHLPNPAQELGKPEISLAIYPNPTTDYLNFQLRATQSTGMGSFRIVNSAGAIVKEFEGATADATYVVPVWDWARGAYFLQYLHNGEIQHTTQFIKI